MNVFSKTAEMEPLTSGQRVFYYDVLRTLAIFAVIFQHVCASDFFFFSFSSDWYFTTFGHSIVRWDVPMFVMISGALFLNPERDFPYRSLFGKYIPRLLIAYLFWKTAYYFIFDFRGSFSLDKFFLSHFHLWFLPMLMGIYMLVPILRKIVRDRMLEQYVLLLWLFCLVFNFLKFSTFFQKMRWVYPLFSMNSVWIFSGYFLLGHYLSHYRFRKRVKKWLYLFGWIGLLGTVAGTFALSIFEREANHLFYDNSSILTVAVSAAIFVWIRERDSKFGSVVRKVVEYVRKDLFGIYLTHVLWLAVINVPSVRHLCSEMVTLPVISVVVFVLSLFTTKFIRCIPLLRKVVM